MRKVRCKRLRNETWRAPGGPGHDGYPIVTRDMQARCVLNEGHLDVHQDHVWGDWREVDRVA